MDGRCRKHPSHRQSKGVCPSCLREKLSVISASGSAATANTTSSSYSSGVTSSSCDRPSSPGRTRWRKSRRERRLKKSRSMACVLGMDAGARGETGSESKGGRGFWKRLLGMEWAAKKRMGEEVGRKVSLHSHTIKETSSARWLF